MSTQSRQGNTLRHNVSLFFMFVVLILAQAVIFNNLVLFNTAVPLVFVYIIIAMPVTWNTFSSLTVGFVAGLIIDVFSNTLGMNALACTLLTFARKPIFHLYMQHDEDLSGACPSQRSMGTAAFLKYALTMVCAYCILLFTIDAFAVFSVKRYILQIVSSTLYTLILIYAIDSILTSQNEKRL